MIISFVVAVYLEFVHEALGLAPLVPAVKLVTGVAITTLVWLTVTLLMPPTDRETLQAFYDRIRPFNWGWRGAVQTTAAEGSFTAALLSWFLGCVVVYAALFGMGYTLYGRPLFGLACALVVVVAAGAILRNLPRVGFE